MPNRAKGARLYLKEEAGKRPVWIIRDGAKRIGLGLAIDEREEAEKRLAEYLSDKHQPSRERDRSPTAISVADVLSIYMADKGSAVARPAALAGRVEALAGFFGTKTLADINGALCRAYAVHRGSEQAARRELEDLRAAINHHRREGLCNAIIDIVLPEKSQPRQQWLTRSEVARLIRAAWRYRQPQGGVETDRHMRRHIARFIIVSIYTGTRSGAVCAASFQPAIGRGHVDLDSGVFHRLPQGKRETNKRQPTIRLPGRLLGHLRRWHAKGISKSAVVEFDGKPIASVKKAFANVVTDAAAEAKKAADRARQAGKVAEAAALMRSAANLEKTTPHTLRHTAVTWAMQGRADRYEAAGFFGLSMRMLETVYGHHHPDHQKGVGLALTMGNKRGREGSLRAGSAEQIVINAPKDDVRRQSFQ